MLVYPAQRAGLYIMALVKNPNQIRLGIAGMVPENGHPFSWAAIINGYDAAAMAKCEYAAIPAYLGEESPGAFGIDGASVTHIWCDKPADAKRVAAASKIPNIVPRAADLIGNVDAILIPTDIGSEHLDRARPFITAGLPIFIDKPLTDRLPHLAEFQNLVDSGYPIMAGSAMRYSQRFAELRECLPQVGTLRVIHMTMCKDWARYGIHALEAIYPMLKPGGWGSVRNVGRKGHAIIHLTHESGVDVMLNVVEDMYGSMGFMAAHGTHGTITAKFDDAFHSFKSQLGGFVSFLKTGRRPYPFIETAELTLMVIAGIMSLARDGEPIHLSDLWGKLQEPSDVHDQQSA